MSPLTDPICVSQDQKKEVQDFQSKVTNPPEHMSTSRATEGHICMSEKNAELMRQLHIKIVTNTQS